MSENQTPSPANKSAKTKPVAQKKNTTAKMITAKPKTPPPPPVEVSADSRPSKKEKKIKVVRDSFTLPQDDYARLSELKQSCLKDGLHVKKSELVRAGLRLLGQLTSEQLIAEMSALEKIKTGRPKSK